MDLSDGYRDECIFRPHGALSVAPESFVGRGPSPSPRAGAKLNAPPFLENL